MNQNQEKKEKLMWRDMHDKDHVEGRGEKRGFYSLQLYYGILVAVYPWETRTLESYTILAELMHAVP